MRRVEIPAVKTLRLILRVPIFEGIKFKGEYNMKTTIFRKPLSFIVCIVLITAMALTAIGCNDNKTPTAYGTITVKDGDTIGEGAIEFPLEIVDGEGNSVNVTVKTDKTTVGEALLDVKLIGGDNGDYGLYVKEVNGVVADYDVDKTYWSFYVDGEYAMSGVDTTDIVDGAKYSLRVEK